MSFFARVLVSLVVAFFTELMLWAGNWATLDISASMNEFLIRSSIVFVFVLVATYVFYPEKSN